MGRATLQVQQLMLDSALADLGAIPDGTVEHGEVFTKRWVVDLILDLAGYDSTRELWRRLAVEPACGAGAFLGPMVKRLSSSCRYAGRDIAEAENAIRAFDLLSANVQSSRMLVEKILVDEGWDAANAARLPELWVQQDDYLLSDRVPGNADFVLGNPPYIRLEDVPADRTAAYRLACPTMIGRADIYIGFIEAGLRSLAPEGKLAFICADRWMRNQYGRELRKLIAERFSLEISVIMHDVDAFDQKVSAYPAVTVLKRATQGPAIVAGTSRDFGAADASKLVKWSQADAPEPITTRRFDAIELPHWFGGEESWPAGSPALLAMIEDLNDRFKPLEDIATGTRVGIGVATGADSVFVTKHADVEPDRLLPLVMAADTASGSLSWSGHHLVNPWDPDGNLIDLNDFPRLRSYFDRHDGKLKGRHVANKTPTRWYRTIDKVDSSLVDSKKLLFPDMKMTIHPVLDEGGLYPHHNLYHVTSRLWDLNVLGGLLLSRVAEAFVEAYAVRMRGGTLRFQAQYLRKIRVPHPSDVTPEDQAALAAAFRKRDVRAATETAVRVYGISHIAGALLDGPWTVSGRRS